MQTLWKTVKKAHVIVGTAGKVLDLEAKKLISLE
jgi:superfamily II DNA/RNA helicase